MALIGAEMIFSILMSSSIHSNLLVEGKVLVFFRYLSFTENDLFLHAIVFTSKSLINSFQITCSGNEAM